MNNLGAGLDRLGQAGPAIALFERALAIAPANAEIYVNYGSALVHQGRVDDAVRALRQAVALAPRDANGHNNLGIALAQQGDLAAARDAFSRALAIDPRHAGARGNLEQVTRCAFADRGLARWHESRAEVRPHHRFVQPGRLVGGLEVRRPPHMRRVLQSVGTAPSANSAETRSSCAAGGPPGRRRGPRRARGRRWQSARGRCGRRGWCRDRAGAACPSWSGTGRR